MKWKLTRRFLTSIVITIIITLLCFFIMNLLLFFKGPAYPKELLEVKAPAMTLEFGEKIQFKNGNIFIEETEISKLKKYSSWLQVLDENGTEVFNSRKPESVPNHYTPGEIVYYHKNSRALGGYTIFLGMVENEGKKWSYIMAFPDDKVAKFSFNFNPETIVGDFLKIFISSIIAFVVIASIVGYLFSVKLTNPILNILEGIKSLSQGNYSKKFLSKGIYKDVYSSLNNLSDALKTNELERKNTEKVREEWIANITHDIKTPLASIKGYSEVILDSDYKLTHEDIVSYVEIILNKSNYMDSLVEDLKLTYQLKNSHTHLNKKDENLVDILRETIIHILNHPKFETVEINFEPKQENIIFRCDSTVLQRAFTNLIFNAVVHNKEHTKVWVRISRKEHIIIEIEDNGNGIRQKDLEKLFERYYRGTNTGEVHKGSGLGMAISKQIIEVHGGTIHVNSNLNRGTKVFVIF
ncbi:sensor histidine kinase [Bacillus sp. NPDC077411]|uniref:sensor histidine kinase n=1 Tax=Bacillus sp. NPDC077411 TaxID=3363947 RepID=UPI0037C85C35